MYQNVSTMYPSFDANKQPSQQISATDSFLSDIPKLLIEIQNQQRALQAELHQLKFPNMQPPFHYQHPGQAAKQNIQYKNPKNGPNLSKK